MPTARSVADEIEDLAAAAMDAADLGRFAQTERLGRRVLRRAEQLAEGKDRQRGLARAFRAIGTAHRARGRYREAEDAFERAMPSAVAAFGPTSVEVAEIHNDLGMTFKYLGRFAEAEEAYEQARRILEGLADADPEDLAALFHNLGGLAHARRDFAAAEPLARRAFEIRSSHLGPRAPATLLDRSAHAAILAGLGLAEEAEASIRGLLTDLETVLGVDHPEVAVALNNLAALVQARGSSAEAELLYRRVIAIKESRLGASSTALAVPLNNLGTVLRAAGRTDEAEVVFERALELLEGSVDADHPNLLAVRRNLAAVRSADSVLANDRTG